MFITPQFFPLLPKTTRIFKPQGTQSPSALKTSLFTKELKRQRTPICHQIGFSEQPPSTPLIHIYFNEATPFPQNKNALALHMRTLVLLHMHISF